MSTAGVERLELSRQQMRAALEAPGPPLEHLLLQRTFRHANESLAPLLAPLARQHPWLLILGAAALGGALVAARPWRWPMGALLPAVLPHLMGRLAQQGLLDGLVAWLRRQPPP